MPKTKISEFSSTPANNTDIDSINIAEGCAPSGINDAIRELMAQLKDFQTGAAGDSFNGPVGTTTAAAGAFTTLSATGNVTLGDASTDTLNVGNGGLIKDASGNLGLGVTPSAWNSNTKALQVNNAALVSFTSGTNVQTWLANNAYYDNATGWLYKNSSVGAALYAQNFNGAHSWQIAPSGTAGNAITFTQAMTLDASGNLALGKTSTSYRLGMQVASSGTNVSALEITNATNASFEVFIKTDTTTVNAGGAGNLVFATGGSVTERARIDSSGNLLLNTTSQNGAGKFSVKYNGSSEQGINIRDTANASGSAYMVFGSSTGTTYGTITNNSNTGVLYNVTSDQRLKQNIVDAPEFGSVIDSIQVRSYDWKSNGSHQRAGFIAQELVTVAPEAVHQPTDTDEMMAVDYSKLVPMLVKEIQSLRQRVAQLESN